MQKIEFHYKGKWRIFQIYFVCELKILTLILWWVEV